MSPVTHLLLVSFLHIMPLILVSNPVCGNKSGNAFVQQHVLPLLAEHSIPVDESVVTNAPNHAGQGVLSCEVYLKSYHLMRCKAVVDFIHRAQSQGFDHISIILSSGDGTLHEIINALLTHNTDGFPKQPLTRLSIALVPNGTANALYSSLFPMFEDTVSYKLQAVQAFVTNPGRSKPLTIAETTLDNTDLTTQTIYSAIVTSTALHASILHCSEELREEYPSLDRFKIAAKNNITRWYESDVQLLPMAGGEISKYDPRIQTFEDIPNHARNTEGVHLEGPFAYFTSTVNVDRLEPLFLISALQSKIPPTAASMEIVALRPKRSPMAQGALFDDHERYAKITSAVLSAAYKGTHADMTFDEGCGDGEYDTLAIAEYIRCGGWKWTPVCDLHFLV